MAFALNRDTSMTAHKSPATEAELADARGQVPRPTSFPNAWKILLWALCLGSASILLTTRHNDFPHLYHPDEPGKVRQVMRGDWNFNHPMLLLATARMASAIVRSDAPQTVAETGRGVSAAFVAVAVVALSLLGYHWRGWPGAIASGVLLVGHHQLFELAHYMKEDTALLMGLSLVFLALSLFWHRSTPGTAAFFGGACGLALSGKYLGGFALALALPVVWVSSITSRQRSLFVWAAFLGALVCVVAAINYPLLIQWGTFQTSFDKEVGLVLKGHGGLTRRVPHSEYLNIFIDNTTAVIAALLAWHLYSWWTRRGASPLPETFLTILPFVYVAALSCSPKSNDRYFLPATGLFTFLAAVGAVDLSQHLRRRFKPRHTLLILLFAASLFEAPRLWRYYRAFQMDDRAELVAWVKNNIPPGVTIAQDGRVKLAQAADMAQFGGGQPLFPKIIGRKFAADLGTIDELRAGGVTHAIVSQSDYGGFFRRSHGPQRGREASFHLQKAWYERLFREGELLWERPRGTVIYLHPGLRVYRLPGGSPPTSSEGKLEGL